MSMPLQDLCELIVDCPHSTAPNEGDGYPLIRTPNIGPGYLDLTDVHRVSKETYDARNARAVPQPMDLILAREAPAGNVGIVREGWRVCLGQRTVLIRPDRNKVDPWYLNYYLNAPRQRHRLLSNANGATVSHVNMPIIRNLSVEVPPLETQRRIASILMAYDNLIENNRKQIALLEEAAQRLYKEWFIDLRFPGHEDVEIVDGVPRGWTLATMDAVCEAIGGGTPSTKNLTYWEGGTIPWVTPSDVTDNIGFYLPRTQRLITEDGLEHSSAKLMPAGTILMTSRASIGYFAICEHDVCTNQGFISCIPKVPYFRWWLLLELKARVNEMKRVAKGSTFLEISRSVFRSLPVVVPDEETLVRFEDRIGRVYRKMVACRKEIDYAREARDRLLPKLMSGEIVV